MVVEDHPWKQTGLPMLSNVFLALAGLSGKTRAQFISLSRCSSRWRVCVRVTKISNVGLEVHAQHLNNCLNNNKRLGFFPENY